MNSCLLCSKDTKNDKYCSRSCAAKVNNSMNPKRVSSKIRKKCLNCEKETMNQKYCSTKCQQDLAKDSFLSDWAAGKNNGSTKIGALSSTVKQWLLADANGKCSRCGWSEINPYLGRCPLEIDHINGDHTDNRKENLRVICPNCHALTGTYKALNSNSNRKKYGVDLLPRTHARPSRIAEISKAKDIM